MPLGHRVVGAVHNETITSSKYTLEKHWQGTKGKDSMNNKSAQKEEKRRMN
jgi:hypothetical protein